MGWFRNEAYHIIGVRYEGKKTGAIIIDAKRMNIDEET